ncbi:MAG: hypothetical protein AAF577_07355 [Pseudomonadota bacterium]
MSRAAIFLATTASLLSAPTAMAAWRTETGQGLTDAQVASGSAVLGVVCNNGDLDIRSGVYVSPDGIGQNGGHVFVIDGDTTFEADLYLGTFEPGDGPDLEMLAEMVEMFRRGSRVAVTFPEGGEAEFSLSGSSRALAPCEL